MGKFSFSLLLDPEKRKKAKLTYTKAIGLIKQQEKINPDDVQLVSNLAAYYSMIGEKQKAYDMVKRSLKLAPNDVEIMFRAGTTYEQLGDRNEALLWLEKAIKNGYSISELIRQPDLKLLIEDDRFKQILQDNQ